MASGLRHADCDTDRFCGVDMSGSIKAETTQHILLVFAGRRPSHGTIQGLCNISSIKGGRFTVARVWTVFSQLGLIIGGSTAQSDLAMVTGIARGMGISCEAITWRDKTYPAGIVQLTKILAPDLICIVPAAIGNGKAIRRAIGVAGRAVKGMVIIDQLRYGR